jgi:hypothetical protein
MFIKKLLQNKKNAIQITVCIKSTRISTHTVINAMKFKYLCWKWLHYCYNKSCKLYWYSQSNILNICILSIAHCRAHPWAQEKLLEMLLWLCFNQCFSWSYAQGRLLSTTIWKDDNQCHIWSWIQPNLWIMIIWIDTNQYYPRSYVQVKRIKYYF